MASFIRILAPAALSAMAAALPLAPATARVASVAPNGLSVVHVATVDASAKDLWTILVEPSLWWNPEHSFTGEAIYLSLEARPNGCFCETIPAGETEGGGIRHFSVVYVDKPRVLRMQGGLGPLQSEAVSGTMTIAMEPRDGKTAVSLSYVVGGYIRTPVADMARSIDQVTGEALARLKAAAEGRDPDKAVFVGEAASAAPTTAPRATEAGAASEETAAAARRAVPDETVEGAAPDEAAGDARATAPAPDGAPRASLAERLQLAFEEGDVELAGSRRSGSRNAADDDASKSDAAADEGDAAASSDTDDTPAAAESDAADDVPAPMRMLSPLPGGTR